MIGYVVSWQSDNVQSMSEDWLIDAGMAPGLMNQNGEQELAEAQRLRAEAVVADERQMNGAGSERPYGSIVTALVNGEGCKIFTYDGEGKLVPYIGQDFDPTMFTDDPIDDLFDDPFDDPVR